MANIVSRVVDCYVFHLSGGVPSFLLLKRNKNKIYEHLWQGVAGKIEKGEAAWETAIRELKEEINIDVSAACLAPLSFTEKNYEKYYVVVLLYVCRKWEGFMKPMENQELAWIFPKDIADYKVLPADKSFFATLRDLI